ncbi:MAG: cell division transport system ATP-binding protein [Bacteriovoracaceae bacterium]|jgi:cell division transport system ATP-binding protein
MLSQKQSLGPGLSSQKIKHSIRDQSFYLQDVTVDFGKIQGLRNVQLSINNNEVLFVTGSSGAGKTTLLKILTGELEPTSGEVILPPKIKFVAPVFQDLRLLERKTCEANLWISYDSSVHGSKKEYLKELNELAKVFGITDRLDMKMDKANGGLKQKVAIIRALLTRPDILVLDEPTSSLDSANAQKLFDVLSFYNSKRGLTVIWATHNRELVKKFSGRIVHLDRGKLVYSGHACFI